MLNKKYDIEQSDNVLWFVFLAIFWWVQFIIHLAIKLPIIVVLTITVGIFFVLADWGKELANPGIYILNKDRPSYKFEEFIGWFTEFGWINVK